MSRKGMIPFSLSTITSWQLKGQIMSSWPDCIASKLRQKVGMNDLETSSVTASKWSNSTPKLDGFVSTLQTGGLFTNKVRAQISVNKASTCSLCDSQDGMIHRLFECPSTAHLRSGDDWEILKDLPRATITLGLFQEPPVLEAYMKLLDSIEPPEFQTLARFCLDAWLMQQAIFWQIHIA